MAWNKPNDNEFELDPWGKKYNNDKTDCIKNKNEKKPIKKNNALNIKNFLCKIGNTIINISRSLNIFKKTNIPFFIVFLVIFFLWFLHGFYIIKEKEQGVVTTFGKFNKLAGSGLNWRPIFINNVNIINVSHIYELNTDGMTLTLDKNIVHFSMQIQYKIINPIEYLFSMSNPRNSLRQSMESAICSVIRNLDATQMITNKPKLAIRRIEKKIEAIIRPYKMGIMILDVNIKTRTMPKEIESSFENMVKSRTKRDQYIHEAKICFQTMELDAHRQAKEILSAAQTYSSHIILKAAEEVSYFSRMLYEYKIDKKITLNHLYLESVETLFSGTKKILINQKKIPYFLIFLNKFLNNDEFIEKLIQYDRNPHTTDLNFLKNNMKKYYFSSLSPNNILEQRRIHTIHSGVNNLEK